MVMFKSFLYVYQRVNNVGWCVIENMIVPIGSIMYGIYANIKGVY